MDFHASNPRITKPTLVSVGNPDPATPPAAGQEIATQRKSAKADPHRAAPISNTQPPNAFPADGPDFPH